MSQVRFIYPETDEKQYEANAAVELVRTALDGLQFGTVEVVVHHGQVVQVERKEKIRTPITNKRKGAPQETL